MTSEIDLISLEEEVTSELLQTFDSIDIDTPERTLFGMPSRIEVVLGLKSLLSAILPGLYSELAIGQDLSDYLRTQIRFGVDKLKSQTRLALAIPTNEVKDITVQEVLLRLISSLPVFRKNVISDIMSAYDGDPAATNYSEIKIAYPGILAITAHRIAHELYLTGIPVIPRIMNEWVHSQTGIDIHPGAEIGEAFFIDHGTGVVIGETAQIGNHVKIYQGVTLGAKSFQNDFNGNPVKGLKRHPTVENDVVIYANAIISGGETVIGARTTVGGGVFLTESVPADSLVTLRSPELKVKPKE